MLRTDVLPLDFPTRVDLQDLFLELSPRASIRVDTRDRDGKKWRHVYVDRTRPSRAPSGPWAVYLANREQRFHRLCFDLDDKRGQVGPDLATLLRWLEEAGLHYVVASSGPTGGRHVWVTSAVPLDAVLVASIGRAAAKRLPTLDHGMLCNPRTGAARPIGAAHRSGGRSRLLQPLDEPQAAALLTPATCRNDSSAFVRLAMVIGSVAAPAPVRPRLAGGGAVEVLDDELGPRLPGTVRTLLDAGTMALLGSRPPADRVSEVLAALLTQLALRRWTWPMVARLMRERRYREGGLLHACTRPGSGALRAVLDEDEALAKLRRQWGRCVAYATTLPLTQDSLEWTERVGDVVALVDQVQRAADAQPQRWATAAGPADRARLDLDCLLALRAGTTVLDLDVRRAALATGHGRSTMHRAGHRLALDGWHAARDSHGPAGTYELLPVTPDHPGFPPAAQGGTQGSPPPGGDLRPLLISRLEARLAAGSADVFSHGRSALGYAGGLGHHTGRTYQLLAENAAQRPLSLAEITAVTGYQPRTVARHLGRLRDLLVVSRAVLTVHHECPTCQAAPGERCRVYGRSVPRRRKDQQHATRQALARERATTPWYRPRSGSLVPAAKALGVHGRTAARARVYAVEIEVYHWWQTELERMLSPRQGVCTGPQVAEEQTALIITTLPRQPHRRYPRDEDGRADHTAARARIQRRIATA